MFRHIITEAELIDQQMKERAKFHAQQYKNADPFVIIYRRIPNEFKINSEKLTIENEIRKLKNQAQTYTGNETEEQVEQKKEKNNALAVRLMVTLLIVTQEKHLKNKNSRKEIATIFAEQNMITPEIKKNIINGRGDIQFNPAAVHAMKTRSPCSVTYQHLRHSLLLCETNRKDKLEEVLNTIDEKMKAHENVPEHEKLIHLEQAILEAYFDARKTQVGRDSRLADTLEWFIKNKHALDLMQKYKNLKVPHQIKRTDSAANLSQLDSLPKRVALIDPDHYFNNTQTFIDKLKFEYDEVILKISNTSKKNLGFNPENFVKKLKNTGLSVRTTEIDVNNLTSQIRNENPGRQVNISTVNYAGDLNIIAALEKYVREQTYLASKEDTSNHFFGAWSAKKIQKNISTANKLINEIKKQEKIPGELTEERGNIPFTDEQIDLVRNKRGSLGKMIARGYQDFLPKSFKEDEKKRQEKPWFASIIKNK